MSSNARIYRTLLERFSCLNAVYFCGARVARDVLTRGGYSVNAVGPTLLGALAAAISLGVLDDWRDRRRVGDFSANHYAMDIRRGRHILIGSYLICLCLCAVIRDCNHLVVTGIVVTLVSTAACAVMVERVWMERVLKG